MVSLVLNPIPNPDFLSNLTAISTFPQKCNLNQPIWNFQIKRQLLSHVQLFVTPGIITCQAPLSIGFFRQEYWSGQPLPSPRDLPNTGIKPGSPAFQADSLPFEPPGKPMLMHCNECILRLKVYWLSNLLPSWTYLVPIIYVMSSAYVILLKFMPASFPPVLVSQIHAPYEKQSSLSMATESFSVQIPMIQHMKCHILNDQ